MIYMWAETERAREGKRDEGGMNDEKDRNRRRR